MQNIFKRLKIEIKTQDGQIKGAIVEEKKVAVRNTSYQTSAWVKVKGKR